MPKLSSSEAAYLLGVSTDTLRRWEKEGKITSSRTEGGHRRYDLTNILRDKEDEGLTILFCSARLTRGQALGSLLWQGCNYQESARASRDD